MGCHNRRAGDPSLKEILRLTGVLAALAGLPACKTFEPKPLREQELLRELQSIHLEGLKRQGAEGPGSGPAIPEFDPARGLSREESVAVALFLNPGLRSFRRGRGVAEGEVLAAGLLPNPELQVTWLHIEHFTRSLATSGFDVALNWAPPRPGERRAKIAKAQAHLDAVQSEIVAFEWRLAAEV